MEGPRSARSEELQSLSQLVDTVFRTGRDSKMFGEFPHYFHQDNLENLFVFVDGERVVSHFGMTRRWASIYGSTVGVASVGAVATYEEYRGQGLATKLFDHSRDEMIRAGIDFMLISGGRGLYRRAGAADFGTNYTAVIETESFDLPSDARVTVTDYEASDFEACRLAYAAKAVHYVRTLDDWEGFLKSRYAMCLLCDLIVVKHDGVFAGYVVLSKASPDGASRLVECAGDERSLFLALKPITQRYGIKKLRLNLQQENVSLRTRMERLGVNFEVQPNVGTLLILNFEQLMKRLTPYFEVRIGIGRAQRLSFKEQTGDVFGFGYDGKEFSIQGRMELGNFIFGDSVDRSDGTVWADIFPVPGLWYGLNYI